MTRQSLWILASPLIFVLACGSSGNAPGTNSPEVKAQGPLYVDETEMTATLAGKNLVIGIVLRSSGAVGVAGDVTVAVDGLDGVLHEEARSGFTTKAQAETLTVAVPAFPDASDAKKQAAYVIRYRIHTGLGELKGSRSLFVAVPRSQIVLIGPKTWYQGEKTRVKVLAHNPVTGKALVGRQIQVRLVQEAGAQEQTVQTDEFGMATVELTPQAESGGELGASMSSDGGTADEVVQPIQVVRLLRVLVTTDKPLYQPGQTMHLRVLAMRKPALAPAKNADCLFEVFDGKGNKVMKQKVKTSDFGVAWTDFKLASEVNVGTYKIKVIVDGTQTEKAVTVDRYSLPKFKVDVALDRPFYIVGDTVKGTVTARYFFGKPVAGASMRLKFYTFDTQFSQFAAVQGVANDDGVYAFETKLPDYLVGQPLEQGQALVRVEAEVTDTAGQVVVKDAAVPVAGAPFDVVVIPESGTIVPGVENRFYVFAEDAVGSPLAAKVQISVGNTTVAADTDASGFSVFSFTPTVATLDVGIAADDGQGHKFAGKVTFAAGVSGEALLVRPDKALYQVGETAKVAVFAPDAKDRVYLDVIRHGQIVREEAVDLKAGKAEIEVDLDSEMTGDVVFTAYYLGRTGQILRDSRLCFVQGADGLVVEVKADAGTYKPGDEAKVHFKVTGQDGKGVVAALGVQVVDEAVFALSDSQPGLLKTYFQLEEEIQKPKFEVHGAHFNVTGIVTDPPEDGAEQQKKEKQAEAAFAAMGDVDQTKSASSWAQAQAQARAVLDPFYRKDLQTIIASVQQMTRDGDLNYDTVLPFLKSQTRFYDPFGNLYVFTVPSDYEITISSLGPDEIAGTGDDWKTVISRWELASFYEDDWARPMAGGMADAAMASDAGMPPNSGPNKNAEGEQVKVRKDFPETLYVNPQILTDGKGEAFTTIRMADSITEWRLSSLANSLDGRLGSATKGLTVFMDFFVDIDTPRTLRRGDEVFFPIAVYNYLATPQTVTLKVEAGDWADLLGPTDLSVSLDPGQVKGLSVGLRANAVGWHGVTVTAKGDTGAADAVMRVIEVTPDGIETRGSVSGKLTGTAKQTVTFPLTAIPGTPKIDVKVYPGVMAQAVEGLDSLLQAPSGCFEQTTSTLWPDTLVLDYMMTSGNINPEIELKAREFVALGYQRLLTFECSGGGFTWFGDPNPPNLILTAMGILEFSDMGRVMEIDETVVPRTVQFLASKQAPDGSWHETQGSEFATVQYDDLMTTCFALWALAQAGESGGASAQALGYVKANLKDAPSTYALALCANALAVAAPTDALTQKVLGDLVKRAQEKDGLVWWDAGESKQYYGDASGGSSIEATALALQALLQAGTAPDLVSRGLAFLVSKKDSFGNWGATHATILSLKAFVKSLSALTQEADGTVTVSINGQAEKPLVATKENADVFYTFELGAKVDPAGTNEVEVSFEGKGTLMYQIVWSYYEPGQAPVNPSGPLTIEVTYDKTQLTVDDTIVATATVTNVSGNPAPMVLVDLGIPPGFDVVADDLQKAVEKQVIQKFEMTGKQIIVYVDAIMPGEVLVLTYKLKAKYPLKVTAPDSSVSLYYDQDSKSSDPGKPIEVK